MKTAFDFGNTPASGGRAHYGYARSGRVTPGVSIVTPFFNTGAVFHETARTVFGQSFQNWEWLIVNDGSTEREALAILAACRGSDPRVRVIDHGENRGLASARNTGFRNATADYVVQLDSDDLLEPTAIEKWLWYLISHPTASFVKGHSVSFGDQEYLWDRGFDGGAEFLEHNLVDANAMIRKSTFEAIGGYREELRAGFEDWDFWLQAAAKGYWGGMVPEYLSWYRRRPEHSDRWTDWHPRGLRQFRAAARRRYPGLFRRGGFPALPSRTHLRYETVPVAMPVDNELDTGGKPGILFLIPWMVTGGADKVNLDWISYLVAQGYRVSICTTLKARQHDWRAQFAAQTSDIFVLHDFLHASEMPRFLAYLIRSRHIATVVISNSLLGYQLLPFLRAHCPGVAFVDLSHAEEPHWLNGGYPRFGIGYQDLLDLNLVSTGHLRRWMIERGADPERIAVCHTGVSVDEFARYRETAATCRDALDVPPGTVLLIYPARLCDQKRPLFLVEVLLGLRQAGVPFLCLIVGDGELRHALERRIRRTGLGPSVRVLGALAHARYMELLAASDILLLPSAYEGISVTLYEAMAVKVAPVVSDVGGQGELATPECGILVPPGENELHEYVKAVKRLVENPALRIAMAEEAYRRVSGPFGRDATNAGFEQALRQATELSRVAPRPAVPPRLGVEMAALALEYARYTVSEPLLPAVTELLARIRRIAIGRRLLSMRLVRVIGHALLRLVGAR